VSMVWKIADIDRPNSLATMMRRKSFAHFTSLLDKLTRPVTILDVGGTPSFWHQMGFAHQPGVEIILLNVAPIATAAAGFSSVIADARQMNAFDDQRFDVVFSNSVIEHVGTFEQQRQMAREVVRVGRRYFVQTPNYSFPIEPHFLFPFFQFLPFPLQVILQSNFDLGWFKRTQDRQVAAALVRSIRLLTERELKLLFPGAHLYKERIAGLTKSFIVYGGW